MACVAAVRFFNEPCVAVDASSILALAPAAKPPVRFFNEPLVVARLRSELACLPTSTCSTAPATPSAAFSPSLFSAVSTKQPRAVACS